MTQFFIKTGNTIPPLQVKLINVDSAYNPSQLATRVQLEIQGRGKRLLQANAGFSDEANAIVSYTFSAFDIATLGKGTFNIAFTVTYADGSIYSYPNDGEQIQLVIS